MSSTRLDHRRSAGVSAGAYDGGERPKVCGPPLAPFRMGLEVPIVPRSEDPAAPALSHAPSPSRKKTTLFSATVHLWPEDLVLAGLAESAYPVFPQRERVPRRCRRVTAGRRIKESCPVKSLRFLQLVPTVLMVATSFYTWPCLQPRQKVDCADIYKYL